MTPNSSSATSVWEAYCDGASRGNPGPASYGVAIIDPSGRLVKEIKKAIGINTNQVAEYEALIRALQELNLLGAERAKIFTDSQFVTKQFSGEYRVKDERMKALMARVREIQKNFKSVQVIHIFRSSHPNNVLVDRLANEALDGL